MSPGNSKIEFSFLWNKWNNIFWHNFKVYIKYLYVKEDSTQCLAHRRCQIKRASFLRKILKKLTRNIHAKDNPYTFVHKGKMVLHASNSFPTKYPSKNCLKHTLLGHIFIQTLMINWGPKKYFKNQNFQVKQLICSKLCATLRKVTETNGVQPIMHTVWLVLRRHEQTSIIIYRLVMTEKRIKPLK